MDVFCGIDWAEGHHDVALIDGIGKLLAKCRIGDDLDGYRLLLDLLAEHGDTPEAPIPVAIETGRGLLVATLRQGPRKICAVNPMAASRYRDRHGVSRKKSDPGDALVLANIIRTDAHLQEHPSAPGVERRRADLRDRLQDPEGRDGDAARPSSGEARHQRCAVRHPHARRSHIRPSGR
nr:transposase [Streptomyces yangpuensis]